MTDDRAVSLLGELLDDPYGRWFVLVALIVVAVVVALLLYVTRRKRINALLDTTIAELKVIRHEVKNDHKTNMRVEQDERHDENKGLLESIDRKVDGVLRVLGEHGYRLDRHHDQIHEIEQTLDRRPEA